MLSCPHFVRERTQLPTPCTYCMEYVAEMPGSANITEEGQVSFPFSQAQPERESASYQAQEVPGVHREE